MSQMAFHTLWEKEPEFVPLIHSCHTNSGLPSKKGRLAGWLIGFFPPHSLIYSQTVPDTGNVRMEKITVPVFQEAQSCGGDRHRNNHIWSSPSW